MLKRIFAFGIAVMILLGQLSALAAVGDTGTYNGFQYKVITDSAVSVTRYTQNAKVVTVPETINGYTVTSIGNAAFQDQNLVEQIILPETVTSINDVNVFWYCRALRSINLPEGLTYLATGAFTMCTSLEEIVIPDGVTRLSKTFRGCSSLRRVVIPDSVTSIDREAFADSIGGTNLLTNVTVYCHEGSYAQTFATQNGINCVATATEIELTYVQNSDGADTVTVTGVKNHAQIPGDFELPETIDGHTVTRIGPEAFKEQSAMTSFRMPDTVTSISYSVFWDCVSPMDAFGVPMAKNDFSNADVVIAFVGEAREMNGEAKSRARDVVPEEDLALLREIKKVGKKLVTVVIAGRPLVLKEVSELSDALLFSGALGSEAGNAYKNLIFGEFNPSAKLVSSFPESVGQQPLYYNKNNTGRPTGDDQRWATRYIDSKITPPYYPFGFGLSYTAYEYSGLRISDQHPKRDDVITVSVEIENTGKYDGEEIAELYIRDKVASNVRPIKELKGFRKVFIRAGEKITLCMSLDIGTLGFYNRKLEYTVEPGEFEIMVGTSSEKYLKSSIFVQ